MIFRSKSQEIRGKHRRLPLEADMWCNANIGIIQYITGCSSDFFKMFRINCSSELDDKQINVHKMDTNTAYDSVYNIIIKPENKICEVFAGNERFERLIDKLRGKITK